MTRAELLDVLRGMLHDQTQPYGWSDPLLLEYLAEGQDKFCEETGYFLDKSTYTITTTLSTTSYDIPDRVYKVLAVWDGTRKLVKFTEAARPVAETFDLSTAEPTEYPEHWQVDAETGTLTLYEAPAAGIVLTLHVWRYAVHYLADLYNVGTPPVEMTPAIEIPRRFHLACAEYAAMKALGGFLDRELENDSQSAKHRMAFLEYCSDGAKAFRNSMAMEITPEPNPLYSFS